MRKSAVVGAHRFWLAMLLFALATGAAANAQVVVKHDGDVVLGANDNNKTTANGSLTVTKDTTINGAAKASKDFEVGGALKADKNLEVTGTVQAGKSISVNGAEILFPAYGYCDGTSNNSPNNSSGPCTAAAYCPNGFHVKDGVAYYVVPDGVDPAYGICGNGALRCNESSSSYCSITTYSINTGSHYCRDVGWKRQWAIVSIVCNRNQVSADQAGSSGGSPAEVTRGSVPSPQQWK